MPEAAETPRGEPESGDAEPSGSAGSEPAQAGEASYDPTGLDLARRVAAQLRGVSRRRTARDASQRQPRGPARFSGSHPDERDPAPLVATVQRLVDESGWSTEVSVHTVLGRWVQIVGPEVAAHCTPESYTDRVVRVTADSTAWATQLRLLAANVVARMNAELGDGTVQRLQVDGPAAPSWRRGRRSVRDGRGPRDTYG